MHKIDTDPNENRMLELFKTIRCLDCDSSMSGIETADSPVSRDMREMVRTLIRKGKSDLDIYREFSDVFGRHAIIQVVVTDGKETVVDPVTHFVWRTGIAATIGFVGTFLWMARRGRKPPR